jgi:hypothetical protein
MRLFANKNKIVKVSTALCSLRGWLNDEVGKVIDAGGNGCDAILCPKGTFNSYGRQTSGGDGACKSCPDGEYAGATGCAGSTDTSDNVEKAILDKIFVETNGVKWTMKEQWETGPVCAYQGVKCSGNNTYEGVEEIDLNGFGLISDIPTEIYKLPYLKKIDFSNNVVGLKFDGIDDALNLEEIIMIMADLKSVEGISSAPSLKRVSQIFNFEMTFGFDANILIDLFFTRSAAHIAQQLPRGYHSCGALFYRNFGVARYKLQRFRWVPLW